MKHCNRGGRKGGDGDQLGGVGIEGKMKLHWRRLETVSVEIIRYLLASDDWWNLVNVESYPIFGYYRSHDP